MNKIIKFGGIDRMNSNRFSRDSTLRDIKRLDKKLDKILKVIKLMEENIMANIQDAVNGINELKTGADVYFGKVQGAFNRLDGKIAELQALIAAGSETQPILDVINSIKADLEAKGAEADIEGTAQ